MTDDLINRMSRLIENISNLDYFEQNEFGGVNCFFCGAEVIQVPFGDDKIIHCTDCQFKIANDIANDIKSQRG